jgi:hypothetical protein
MMVGDAVTVGFPIHKGADGWMSPKQYENIYISVKSAAFFQISLTPGIFFE